VPITEGSGLIGLPRGIVKLLPYSSEWERLFEEEKRLLQSSIGNYAIDVQHVGSTAIPGLEAKPIIDIAVAVQRLQEMGKYIGGPLERLGYEFRREEPRSVLFAKGNPSRRTHYLHIVEWKSDSWKNYLLFRDYLRKHKEVADEYSKIKRELAQKFQTNRGAYTEGKAQFIESALRLAKCEFDT